MGNCLYNNDTFFFSFVFLFFIRYMVVRVVIPLGECLAQDMMFEAKFAYLPNGCFGHPHVLCHFDIIMVDIVVCLFQWKLVDDFPVLGISFWFLRGQPDLQ